LNFEAVYLLAGA